jgi:hypothetical protein
MSMKRTWRQSVFFVVSATLATIVFLSAFVGGYGVGYVQGYERSREFEPRAWLLQQRSIAPQPIVEAFDGP